MSNQICPITLGRIIIAARRSRGLSQRELAQLIADKFAVTFNHVELSKIENDSPAETLRDRIDVRDRNYDWFIQVFCELFDADINWVEQIRQQTTPQQLDSRLAVFPVYINCNLIDGH